MKTVAIVQARMSSTRFPGKVLSSLHGQSLVSIVGARLSRATKLDQIVFAISCEKSDDPLEEALKQEGYEVFRGSLHDVQQRFIDCATHYGASNIVRVTADCPLIDWKIVDQVVDKHLQIGADYSSNVHPATFPDGLDVEAFSLESLVQARQFHDSEAGREHVTIQLRESGHFDVVNLLSEMDLSKQRWTVDYPSDLSQMEKLLPLNFQQLNFRELVSEGFSGVVSSSKRNEGMNMGAGQKLWQRAKAIIPGGGMLLSKRAEMHHPTLWPSYFSRAEGIEVTDLDGNQYLDFSMMSVGSCSLGYGVKSIDEAVKGAVDDGVMSSLNSPAEVELAERLIAMHPWAAMARFARSGGEANAIAIRIARAATGRDKVAFCGYHGWHDWYLSANLAEDSNLDGHLIPGLEPKGVPRSLKGTSVPFAYNDLASLEKLLKTQDFAAVKMEVFRNSPPNPGFLEGVRELCSRFGTILIFDECTSGFRETFGGLHSKYGVEPDLAMFGKALGNGFAITAVIGKGSVMQAAQDTFISSTFWTERLGPVAALATLDVMETTKSWEKISETGATVKSRWMETFDRLSLPGKTYGLDALAGFSLDVPNWNEVKTLFTQKMLERGYLATATFYASLAHNQDLVDKYVGSFNEVFEEIAVLLADSSVELKVKGPAAHAGFRRLN